MSNDERLHLGTNVLSLRYFNSCISDHSVLKNKTKRGEGSPYDIRFEAVTFCVSFLCHLNLYLGSDFPGPGSRRFKVL